MAFIYFVQSFPVVTKVRLKLAHVHGHGPPRENSHANVTSLLAYPNACIPVSTTSLAARNISEVYLPNLRNIIQCILQ